MPTPCHFFMVSNKSSSRKPSHDGEFDNMFAGGGQAINAD
jgi:hypothetical protein